MLLKNRTRENSKETVAQMEIAKMSKKLITEKNHSKKEKITHAKQEYRQLKIGF